MKKKTKFKTMGSISGKLKPTETMPSTTQKSDSSGNKADKSLATLMSGKVFPSYGKKATRPTGANKDRRNS